MFRIFQPRVGLKTKRLKLDKTISEFFQKFRDEETVAAVNDRPEILANRRADSLQQSFDHHGHSEAAGKDGEAIGQSNIQCT